MQIEHGDGLVSHYFHLRDFAKTLKEPKAGSWRSEPIDVEAGQVIGHVGVTGTSTGPHLHFEVTRGNTPKDPLHWLIPGYGPRDACPKGADGSD